MSECVVRMDVPENCYECDMFMYMFVNDCPIYQKPGGQGKKHKYTSSRHPDCPIICSLPEGHGRLADASTVIYLMQVPVTVDDASWLVHALPTIVPAERSDE